MRAATKLCYSLRLSLTSSSPNQRLLYSTTSLEESIKTAIKTQNFHQIPDLLLTAPKPHKNPNPNPFSFLSSFSEILQTQIIDQILQSLIPIRPRSRTHATHSFLLSQTLQNPNPNPNSLPLALAVLQRTIRCGCIPVPQTHLSLSIAWLDRRQSAGEILSEMRQIGYRPDLNTCNYLISSLCSIDETSEAVRVLQGMRIAGCDPDSESYDMVIGSVCGRRWTDDAVEMVREMVEEFGLSPKQGTVVRAVAAMRANREVHRAAEMVGFLQRKGCGVGFQSYEMVVEGCLEREEFVLAGKVMMEMVGKGFIPYIRVRQEVVEGLASVGEEKLACAVRQRLAELEF
ncbi:pentatricopeptide repeat (PPR) superfamily protein [Tasmannia lanceolata]|uniref:pentatricopeptide repeat (PPR) superfamily protein n=1 Tax=Tasmannia lanceolata TaxID=3420 RepID=UPI0040645699